MRRSERFFPNSDGSLVRGLGFGVPALRAAEFAKIVQSLGQIAVFPFRILLFDRERPFGN